MSFAYGSLGRWLRQRPIALALCLKGMGKLVRNFALGVSLLAAGIFLPAIPTLLVSNNDPVDVSDHRVKAELSDADLKEILFLVRSEYLTSVYELVLLNGTDEILAISESRGGIQYSPSNNSEEGIVVPPNGKITVTIGFSCGYLCGSGMNYYLDTENGKWYIKSYSQWIS